MSCKLSFAHKSLWNYLKLQQHLLSIFILIYICYFYYFYIYLLFYWFIYTDLLYFTIFILIQFMTITSLIYSKACRISYIPACRIHVFIYANCNFIHNELFWLKKLIKIVEIRFSFQCINMTLIWLLCLEKYCFPL